MFGKLKSLNLIDIMKFYLQFFLLFIVENNIFPQIDTNKVVNIQEVIISENRIQVPFSQKPSGIITIGSEIIDHSAVQSVADLLHYVAGVDIRQRGSNGIQSDAGIRGSSFDQVLIMINGIRISDPQTGHHSFNLPVDISNIDHIEVYKGPSARVFGQNAFAGAINIITRNPVAEFIRLELLGGDFGLVGGTLSASISTGNVKNYLSVNHNRSSGYKYNTDYEITDIYYQSEAKTSYGTFSLLSGITDRKFGANGFYSGPEFKEQYESVQTTLVALSFLPAMKNHRVKLTNRFYWRSNRDEYLFIRDDPSFYRNMHINNITGLDVNLTIRNNLGLTGIGIDMNIPWINSNRLGNGSYKNATLFIEHRIELLKKDLSITPGIQINVFSGFENNILPGIDIGYSLNPSLLVYVNSGYTYRVPTFTDLYYEDPANSSNPELQPEYALSNEAGLKTIKINGITGQVCYFSRKNLNLIDRSKENLNDKWKPQNIGEVKMSGIDFNLTIQPGKLMGLDYFIIQRFDIGYTYIHSEVVDKLPAFSKFALENLRNQLVLGLELKYFRNLYQTVNLRYADRVNMEDFMVADTRIGVGFPKFRFYVDLTNIFNVEYRETNFVTLPGRWFKVGGSYQLSLK